MVMHLSILGVHGGIACNFTKILGKDRQCTSCKNNLFLTVHLGEDFAICHSSTVMEFPGRVEGFGVDLILIGA